MAWEGEGPSGHPAELERAVSNGPRLRGSVALPIHVLSSSIGNLVRRQDLMLGLAWVPLAPPVPRSIAIGSLGDVGRDDGSKAGILASTGRASGTPKFGLEDTLAPNDILAPVRKE